MDRKKELTGALVVALIVALGILLTPTTTLAQQPVPDWPDHYDPFTLLTYNLEMTEANWDTIRYDLTNDIEVPALFWAEAEAPILISARRKSCDSLPLGGDPEKVSLKLDLNEYTIDDGSGNDICEADYGFIDPTGASSWHDLKKLSLENGDDNNTVTEGYAWYLHRLAGEHVGPDYTPGMASWIVMNITITERVDAELNPLPDLTFYNGVFVNVEQRDKTFLKNNDFWAGGDDTWFFKYSDMYTPEFDEAPENDLGDPLYSPTFNTLCFLPFQKPASIGDFVWADGNGDGIQDLGELGVPDVGVRLYDPGQDGVPGGIDDVLMATEATDATGAYSFIDIPIGYYYLEFVLPDGAAFTLQNQGLDDTLDSDADPSTGRTVVVSLHDGNSDITWDAGLNPAGTGGQVTPDNPYGPNGLCATPDPETMATLLPNHINMVSLLTLGAVDGFHVSPDSLLSKGKNFFFADYRNNVSALDLRKYNNWDLDSAMSGLKTTDSIYDVCKGQGCEYEQYILENPTIQLQYNSIMQYLLDGPFNETDLNADLTTFEALLGAALTLDPNDQLGDPVDEYFASLRDWNTERIVDVQGQIGPLSVQIVSFTAGAQEIAILIEWETASEIDNLGFYLYRSEIPSGGWLRLNETLIPSQVPPGSPIGAVYTWLDRTVESRATYYYWLEAVDTHGQGTLHGPVEAQAPRYVRRMYFPVFRH